jgi:hypothetical protein
MAIARRRTVPDPVWDPSGKARAALGSIVSDFGTRSLSTPSILDNVLRDLLPDSPKQVSLIVAAGGSPVAMALQEHVAQGMDPDTAVRLASARLTEQTPFDAAGCRWVTAEFARALGYAVSDEPVAPSPAPAPPAPVGQPTPPLMPITPAPTFAPRPDQAETVLPGTPGAPTAEPRVAPTGARHAAPGSSQSRKVPVLIAVVILVLGGLVIGADIGHVGPFAKKTPVVALTRLLPDDLDGCSGNVNLVKGLTGLTARLGCNVDAIHGEVFAYQFDTPADLQAGLARFNSAEAFTARSASSECPPKSSQGEGLTEWHNSLFKSTSGQVLECFSVSQGGSSTGPLQPTYIWSLPAENIFFQAFGGDSTSMKSLDTWWSNHAGPFHDS